MATGNAAKRAKLTTKGPWVSWRIKARHARCIKFLETYCRQREGYSFGKPLRLAKFQKEFLEEALAPGVRSAVLSIARGNGKSSLLGGVATWALFDADETPSIPVVATKIGQAVSGVYGVAAWMIRREPELANRSIEYTGISNPRVWCSTNEGMIFPVASDEAGLQGLNPSLAIADEIGFLGRRSFEALRLASGKRPTSLVVGIGTPGTEKIVEGGDDNALWFLRSRIREGVAIPGLVYREIAAPDGCKIEDEALWPLANPALAAGYLDIDQLRQDVKMTTDAAFRTFRLGQWVDGFSCWLGEDGAHVWDALEAPYKLVDGAPTWIGVDIGLKHDATAVVLVQYRPDERMHATCKLWMAKQSGDVVNLIEVMDYLRHACQQYKVGAISYDPHQFQVAGQFLHDEGLPMVDFPQSPDRMTPVFSELYKLIKSSGITHDYDQTFREHILNAREHMTRGGFTLEKNKSRGRIDAAYALALAVDRAQHKSRPKPKLVIL